MNDVLDDALEAIARTAPNLQSGNSNHAPMVVETLVTLGRGDAVPRWIDRYSRELDTQERPSQRPALEGDWREGLGKPHLWADWVALFRRELSESSWRDVLDPWAARLAPGLSGEATHGLIRTAHAARALGQAETPPRLNELADALAYWAATYRDFGPAPPKPLHFTLDAALTQVPDFDPLPEPNIDATLDTLKGSGRFAPVINLLKTGPDPLDDLSTLTERFAAVYLNNSRDPARVFAVVHAVTGPSALRLLAPYVTRSTRGLLFLYAWQTAAAIYGIWGKDRGEPAVLGEDVSAEYLTEAAIANGAAHAIKFAEACLREYEHNPAPVFRAAAADAVVRLRG